MSNLLNRCFLAAFAAAPLLAGGFWIQLGNPDANPEAKSKGAIAVVKPAGCHNPEKALVTGTVEGIVNGRRVSHPLTLVALSTPGEYAVTSSRPEQGPWVVALTAQDGDRVTGAIFVVEPNGFTRNGAQFVPHAPTSGEVQTALNAVSALKAP